MAENKYDIAAFIWPSYSGNDPRSRLFWEEGYGEWQTVKKMTNRGYPGCQWPRKPVWGYVNEADPDVMEMQIREAVAHKVNVFIYDWYWYDNRAFLENCLNEGFLGAKNNKDMKFYLMWANHDATYLWDMRNSFDRDTVIWSGTVTEKIFSEICDRTIEKYFTKENYYRIDGCPVYMFYDFNNLVRSFGTVGNIRKMTDMFRKKAVDAGFPGLHLQIVHNRHDWAEEAIDPSDPAKNMTKAELMKAIGMDSFTDYNWCQTVNVNNTYPNVVKEVEKKYEELANYGIPFFPNITVGWDNNVRYKSYVPRVMTETSPENIKKGCEAIKKYVDRQGLSPKLITVNSWNEWTESSYLEPDDLNGYGYLDAIKETF